MIAAIISSSSLESESLKSLAIDSWIINSTISFNCRLHECKTVIATICYLLRPRIHLSLEHDEQQSVHAATIYCVMARAHTRLLFRILL